MSRGQTYGMTNKLLGIMFIAASILLASAGSLNVNDIIGVFNIIIANPLPYAASFVLAMIGGWLLTKY